MYVQNLSGFLTFVSLFTIPPLLFGVETDQPLEDRHRSFAQEADEDDRVIENRGFLFVQDQWVARPYRIQTDALGLTINGIACPIDAGRSDTTGVPADRRSGSESGQRLGAGRLRGFTAGWAGPSWVDTDHRLQFAARRLASRVAETLLSDGIVLLHADRPPVHLELVGSRFSFLNTLTKSEPDTEFLAEVAPHQHKAVLSWIDAFQVPTDLHRLATGQLEQYEQNLASDRAVMAALRLMDALNYPLTMVGMLLGVLAFGHILKWTARMVADDAGSQQPTHTRCVEIALLLMLAMSVLDLLWTAIAYRAGVMREINPLAAQLVASPIHLIAFKVAATGAGGAILFIWRRRTQIQQATWWMCLVCVLLTFRWVVFDSVLN